MRPLRTLCEIISFILKIVKKGFFIILFILFFLTGHLNAQIISTHNVADEKMLVSDSILMDQDSITGDVVTHTPLTIYFYNTLVFLNKYDTISHYTSIRRNYTEQFLEIYDSKKILPASRIYGFVRGNSLFRSASLGNRNYVFAKRINSGKLNLFSADRLNSVSELEVVGAEQSGIYHNRILVQDENRNKVSKNSIDYFFIITNKSDTLIPFSASRDVAERLNDNKEASKYVLEHIPKPGYKTTRILCRFLFISSVLANIFITGHDDEGSQKIIRATLIPAGIAFLGTSVFMQDPTWDFEDINKTTELYNASK